ncbi:MAG: hypothetical protein H7A23_20895 [Leptospiraceae bacterium]|nr:hypothetical protein [Leptospiraceae bacterium]
MKKLQSGQGLFLGFTGKYLRIHLIQKIKQDDADKYRSAKAFHRVKTVFEPVKSESMDNGQIMEHTQRNY